MPKDRRASGKFASQCRNVYHQTWRSTDSATLVKFRRLSTDKKKHIKLVEFVNPKGKLAGRSKLDIFICHDCHNYAKQLASIATVGGASYLQCALKIVHTINYYI